MSCCELLCLRLVLNLELSAADRLEGAPRQLRRRWSDEFKARWLRHWSQARAYRRSLIGSAFIVSGVMAPPSGSACDC